MKGKKHDTKREIKERRKRDAQRNIKKTASKKQGQDTLLQKKKQKHEKCKPVSNKKNQKSAQMNTWT